MKRQLTIVIDYDNETRDSNFDPDSFMEQFEEDFGTFFDNIDYTDEEVKS